MAGRRPREGSDMDDVAVDIDDRGDGSDGACTHENVGPGHDTGGVSGAVDEGPWEARLVHRVQINHKIDVVSHDGLPSGFMVGVRPATEGLRLAAVLLVIPDVATHDDHEGGIGEAPASEAGMSRLVG